MTSSLNLHEIQLLHLNHAMRAGLLMVSNSGLSTIGFEMYVFTLIFLLLNAYTSEEPFTLRLLWLLSKPPFVVLTEHIPAGIID